MQEFLSRINNFVSFSFLAPIVILMYSLLERLSSLFKLHTLTLCLARAILCNFFNVLLTSPEVWKVEGLSLAHTTLIDFELKEE